MKKADSEKNLEEIFEEYLLLLQDGQYHEVRQWEGPEWSEAERSPPGVPTHPLYFDYCYPFPS